MKIKTWLLDMLKGTTIGFAIPIPGVSGGTMAVLTGLFDKISDAVSNMKKHFGESIRTLIPIGLGALLMAIIGFIGIKKGFDYAPFALSSLFAGLISGSTPVITNELKKSTWSPKAITRTVIGFVVAAGVGIASALIYYFYDFSIGSYLLSGVWWVYPIMFVAGFIGALAAVVPGISGSMIMYLMGLYVPLVSLFTTFSNYKNSALYGVIFGGGALLILGCLVGFILTNVWMKKLLTVKHDETYQVILGFILGSLISMFVNPQMIKTNADTGARYWIYETTPVWEWIVGVALFIISACVLFYLTKRSQKKKEEKLAIENVSKED
ncbi:MAG: DUF368 domain-containing protein [Bacilli bacterium]|jgi:putative membrane protein|nr:DUF368 domain-containing protein [Bacilli bacterium]